MKNNILENVILFDWLTCTCKTDEPEVWQYILGMENLEWEQLEKGRHGYRKGLFHGSITILYDGAENAGCCLEMSGQGCRTYEEEGKCDWVGLFAMINESDDFNITRLDVAFDDHTGILDLKQLWKDTQEEQFVSKTRKHTVEKSWITGEDAAITIYHGSKKSDVLLRIYDKAKERGVDHHWIRVEFQFRDDRASAFIRQSADVGTVFSGVLHNYIRYVDEDPADSNRWRWPMKQYWEQLINGVAKISLFITPGVEYNLCNLTNFLNQAAPAMKCGIDLFGTEYMLNWILGVDISDKPKYRKLKQDFAGTRREQQDLIRQLEAQKANLSHNVAIEQNKNSVTEV